MMAEKMDCLRSVQLLQVHDTSRAISTFIDTLGFELDEGRADGPPERSLAILRRGKCEVRICYVVDPVTAAEVIFLCDDVESWQARLEARGFETVMCKDVGMPLTLNCQITNELLLTIEAVENPGDG